MSDFNNPEEIREFLLQESLPDGLCLETERRDNSIYIPSLETTITPGIHQPQGTTIGIDFDGCKHGFVDVPVLLHEWV